MLKKITGAIAVLAIITLGLVIYAFLKPTEEASGTIAAIPINQASEESDSTTGAYIFEIIPEQSEARFEINEVLRGDPVTVVGTTNQVAGQFSVNPSDLTTTEVGVIQVNARTLATDNNFRNRAIKNQILLTDDYEFVTFTPKQVIGLSGAGNTGETYTFQIIGDLTITSVTKEVTFDVTATAVSATRLEAVASTAFLYTDFNLFIPDAPVVDTVDDEVRLELDFTAEAVE